MTAPKNRPVYGILMMLFAMSCIGIVDAFGKLIMQTMPQLQVVGGYFLMIWLCAIVYGLGRGIKPKALFRSAAPLGSPLQAL